MSFVVSVCTGAPLSARAAAVLAETAAGSAPAHPLLELIAVLIAIIVGMSAGILLRADGASYPKVITRAGVAFAGSLTLIILLMDHLHLL